MVRFSVLCGVLATIHEPVMRNDGGRFRHACVLQCTVASTPRGHFSANHVNLPSFLCFGEQVRVLY